MHQCNGQEDATTEGIGNTEDPWALRESLAVDRQDSKNETLSQEDKDTNNLDDFVLLCLLFSWLFGLRVWLSLQQLLDLGLHAQVQLSRLQV